MSSAEKDGYSCLPAETLLRIAECVTDIPTIKSLSETNKFSHQILDEILYKHDVQNPKHGCCRALLALLLNGNLTADDETKAKIAQRSVKAGGSIHFWVQEDAVLSKSPPPSDCEVQDAPFSDEQKARTTIPAITAAAMTDCVPLLKAFISAGGDIKKVTGQHLMSPVQMAVYRNCPNTALFLMDELRLLPREGEPPVSEAGLEECGKLLDLAITRSSLDVMRAMVSRKAVPARPFSGDSPLRSAVIKDNCEMVSILLSADFDVNAAHQLGQEWTTLFARACSGSQLGVVQLLHDDRRVDVDLAFEKGPSPVGLALQRWKESPETVRFLVRSDKARTARKAAFFWAVDKGEYALAEEVVQAAKARDKLQAGEWIRHAESKGQQPFADLIRKEWKVKH